MKERYGSIEITFKFSAQKKMEMAQFILKVESIGVINH